MLSVTVSPEAITGTSPLPGTTPPTQVDVLPAKPPPVPLDVIVAAGSRICQLSKTAMSFFMIFSRMNDSQTRANQRCGRACAQRVRSISVDSAEQHRPRRTRDA